MASESKFMPRDVVKQLHGMLHARATAPAIAPVAPILGPTSLKTSTETAVVEQAAIVQAKSQRESTLEGRAVLGALVGDHGAQAVRNADPAIGRLAAAFVDGERSEDDVDGGKHSESEREQDRSVSAVPNYRATNPFVRDADEAKRLAAHVMPDNYSMSPESSDNDSQLDSRAQEIIATLHRSRQSSIGSVKYNDAMIERQVDAEEEEEDILVEWDDAKDSAVRSRLPLNDKEEDEEEEEEEDDDEVNHAAAAGNEVLDALHLDELDIDYSFMKQHYGSTALQYAHDAEDAVDLGGVDYFDAEEEEEEDDDEYEYEEGSDDSGDLSYHSIRSQANKYK